MSQAPGTAGRPCQDGATHRNVPPASTPLIPAIGSKKDLAAVLQARSRAAPKVPLVAKVWC